MSLSEVLVTLVLLSLLLSMAMPSFSDSLSRQRLQSSTAELRSILQLAKQEAIRRGEPITLERLTNCPIPSSSAEDWSCGWKLSTAAEQLHTTELAQKLTITHTLPLGGDAAQVAVDRWGYVRPSGQRFVFSATSLTSNPPQAKTVCINSMALVRILDGNVAC